MHILLTQMTWSHAQHMLRVAVAADSCQAYKRGLQRVCAESLHRPQDAMIMGADYYESDKQRAELLSAGRNPIGIGDNCTISNTIVDKNARIGANCTIVNKVRQ